MDLHRFQDFINEERLRQKRFWGDNDFRHSNEEWYLILSEEVGEVAQAILTHPDCEDYMIEELAQCVAVIQAWIESLEEHD